MSSPKRTPTGSRSGSYVHEAQRHTERVVLRLPPDVAATLRSRAAEEEMTLASYIARLVTIDSRIV